MMKATWEIWRRTSLTLCHSQRAKEHALVKTLANQSSSCWVRVCCRKSRWSYRLVLRQILSRIFTLIWYRKRTNLLQNQENLRRQKYSVKCEKWKCWWYETVQRTEEFNQRIRTNVCLFQTLKLSAECRVCNILYPLTKMLLTYQNKCW